MDINKIHENSTIGTSIRIVNNRCVKHHNKSHRDNFWLNEYNKLQNFETRLIKVYSVNESEKTLEMEFINKPFQTLADMLREKNYNREILMHCLVEYMDIYKNFFEYSKQFDNGMMIHHDFTLKNVILIEEKEIKVLDPDSVSFMKTDRYYGSKGGKYLESFMMLYSALEFLK